MSYRHKNLSCFIYAVELCRLCVDVFLKQAVLGVAHNVPASSHSVHIGIQPLQIPRQFHIDGTYTCVSCPINHHKPTSYIFLTCFHLQVLASWGLGEASGSVAVLLGCLVNNVKAVSELAPLIFVPQLLFSGFFIRTSLIPIYLRWAQYLCALKYALNLILITEFSLSTPACSASCQAMNVCANVLEENDIVREAWWVYALVLFCLFAVFRVVAAVVLVLRAARSF